MADETPTPDENEEQAAAPAETAPPTEATSETPPEVEAVDPDVAESVGAPASEVSPEPAEQSADQPAATPVAETDVEEDEDDDEPVAPREKPAIPGMDLEVDIVMDGDDKSGLSPYGDEGDLSDAADEQLAAADEDTIAEPIAAVSIDLAAGATYKATGKRKTAIARVTLKPGTGAYTINGKTLDEYFPRATLRRNIRQPLEAVGYEERMDVIANMLGGGVSAQAGALRHGVSRALLEADPNLRGELKRRGFLTRDARAKERKKAGLKKARKKPQFSKR
ncbi:MAG: SSU ribosomal protein S9p (S16e) [uncultured Solirubrobacteraceae bacterium]|uniref:Small ribosomal subunit protein uS9 n=1 Tax=uncultured Solirubrobacteraceae bacterium TaxID=1162706 RepID=A0A6J4SIT3_9ACTN|nr:MAG: SSU ribosomal protein S9p (S16e) [uncultured Solirubrobacteraceae bacterium]